MYVGAACHPVLFADGGLRRPNADFSRSLAASLRERCPIVPWLCLQRSSTAASNNVLSTMLNCFHRYFHIVLSDHHVSDHNVLPRGGAAPLPVLGCHWPAPLGYMDSTSMIECEFLAICGISSHQHVCKGCLQEHLPPSSISRAGARWCYCHNLMRIRVEKCRCGFAFGTSVSERSFWIRLWLTAYVALGQVTQDRAPVQSVPWRRVWGRTHPHC